MAKRRSLNACYCPVFAKLYIFAAITLIHEVTHYPFFFHWRYCAYHAGIALYSQAVSAG
jgi:hypothetical protein